MKVNPLNSATDPEHAPNERADRDHNGDGMSPLPGEPGIPDIAAPRRPPLSKKGLFAVLLLVGSFVAVAAVSIHRVAASGKRSEGSESALTRDKPAAASLEAHKLDFAAVPPPGEQQASSPRIPALAPTTDELAEPIGVRRTGAGPGTGAPAPTGSKPALPEDAPVLLVSTRPGSSTTSLASNRRAEQEQIPMSTDSPSDLPAREDPMASTSRNLEDYQRRLQGLMDSLTKSTAVATAQPAGQETTGSSTGVWPGAGSPAAHLPGNTAPAGGGLFGGQLQGSTTSRVMAAMLGNRSLTLPKGTAFTCALKTKVVSATSGLVGCEVQRNLYGDDGRVLLVERGSHLDGEYRIASVKPGTVRIPVIWTRIRTPFGVTVDLESPGTGQLGESGIDGYVDNRWSERIGAAMLLSLIDDSVKLVIQNQANEQQANTVVLPSTTANTSKLAEKVLDSTINIPPLIYQNQGGIVGIYVARDLDFSSVYELRPTPLPMPRRQAPEAAP